jgi:hypothetical protein
MLFMPVCLSVSAMLFHLWETLKKLPIAYRLKMFFVCLTAMLCCLSVCLICIFTCERLWKSCLSPNAYHLKMFFVCLSVYYVFFLSVCLVCFSCLSVCLLCIHCLSVCLVYIFIFERLWKSCLSPIAYHLNVYQVSGMSYNVFIFLFDYNKILSVCLLWIFVCERLWKSCLSPIAYHLNVYQVRGMSSFLVWL